MGIIRNCLIERVPDEIAALELLEARVRRTTEEPYSDEVSGILSDLFDARSGLEAEVQDAIDGGPGAYGAQASLELAMMDAMRIEEKAHAYLST